jgi:hypothetical protein
MRTRSPHSSSRTTPWLFGLWVVGLCALCLGFAAHKAGRTLVGSRAEARASFDTRAEPRASLTARWQLTDDESAMMSCAEEPSSSDEPLWCASPDSPHCTRGTPAPSASDAGLSVLWTFAADTVVAPRLLRLRAAPTQSPVALLGHAQGEESRLERPPRSA